MPQVGVIFSTCVIMLHNLSLEFHQRKDRKFTKNVTPLHLYIVYSDEITDVQNDDIIRSLGLFTLLQHFSQFVN